MPVASAINKRQIWSDFVLNDTDRYSGVKWIDDY